MNNTALASSEYYAPEAVGTRPPLYGYSRGVATAGSVTLGKQRSAKQWYGKAVATAPILVFPSISVATGENALPNPIKDLEMLFAEIDAMGDSITVMSYDELRAFRAAEDKRLSDRYGFED